MPPKSPDDARHEAQRPRSAQVPATPDAPAVQPSVPLEAGDTVVMRVASATPAAHEPPRQYPGAPAPHADAPFVPEARADAVVMTVATPGPPIPHPIPPVPKALPDAIPVEVPVVVVPTPSVHAAPDAPAVVVPPTLGEAFQTLCAALAPHFMDDAAAYEHCLLIHGWHGPSVANQHVAWSHAMQLLGRVLDKKIEA